jgi:hemolysin III
MVEVWEREAGRDIRPQSLGEEIANAVSHGIGLLAAIVASPFLVIAAARRGGPAVVVGTSVFAAAIVLLYLTSTLYHAFPAGRVKRAFRVIDHAAIFLLIAGTYTPFTLGVLRGGWGWTIFGLVWGLAILGISLKAIAGVRFPVLSTCLYIGMGWLALIAFRPIWSHMPMPGILWLAAGGIAYTAGVAFYAFDRVRYLHFVWHLFVLAGTACHFVAVLNYAS